MKSISMKFIAFSVLLGIGTAAQAAPVRTLNFNDSGCVEAPFNVQRGSTYLFQHTHSEPLSLTIQPANSRIIVKDPQGRRIALRTVSDEATGSATPISIAPVTRQGRYTITFPRTGKIESLCVNAAS